MTDDYAVIKLSAENLYDVEVMGSDDEDLEDVEASAKRMADKATEDALGATKESEGKGIQ